MKKKKKKTLNRNRKNYNLRDGSLHTEEKTVLDMTTFFFFFNIYTDNCFRTPYSLAFLKLKDSTLNLELDFWKQ